MSIENISIEMMKFYELTQEMKYKEERCPHIKRYPEGPDFCEHMGHTCLLESSVSCEEWDSIQEEWRTEQ